ncbi:TPA: Lrp/AsnC family transcriptional regulator [Escherichia coli]|nr:Lrp/AsnC family transcriptional regulator [Escherichia coli]
MKLTKTERKVYDLLAVHCRTGGHQISLIMLADRLGVSRQSVKLAIRSLEQAGVIAICRSKLHGRQQANVYVILKIKK